MKILWDRKVFKNYYIIVIISNLFMTVDLNEVNTSVIGGKLCDPFNENVPKFSKGTIKIRQNTLNEYSKPFMLS